jgi:23S rRNA (adenine2030-N6)-methyltransferase
MNYRHDFHAGNFADVLKHIVLVACLGHLAKKASPFRVIDTHAGAGLYDLAGAAAGRTGEWEDGIGRILAAHRDAPVAGRPLLESYLDVIARIRQQHGAHAYPGSPAIARLLLRPGDRMVVNELHETDRQRLSDLLGTERRAKVLGLDAWMALKSLLPPRERRGVVLVDPPFEEPGELIRLTEGFSAALDRFAGGIYLLWYPIKDVKPVARFHRAISEIAGAARLDRAIAVELMVRAPRHPERLNGTGLVVANGPFTLTESLDALLPWLAATLADGEGAHGRILDLAGRRDPR